MIFNTYCRCGFVQYKQLALAHKRASQGNYLTLTNGQVISSARDGAVQRKPDVIVSLQGEQAGCAESVVQCNVIIFVKQIKITANSPAQQLGLTSKE